MASFAHHCVFFYSTSYNRGMLSRCVHPGERFPRTNHDDYSSYFQPFVNTIRKNILVFRSNKLSLFRSNKSISSPLYLLHRNYTLPSNHSFQFLNRSIFVLFSLSLLPFPKTIAIFRSSSIRLRVVNLHSFEHEETRFVASFSTNDFSPRFVVRETLKITIKDISKYICIYIYVYKSLRATKISLAFPS